MITFWQFFYEDNPAQMDPNQKIKDTVDFIKKNQTLFTDPKYSSKVKKFADTLGASQRVKAKLNSKDSTIDSAIKAINIEDSANKAIKS